MNIQEILDEIKKLNDTDIIKFNKEFSTFYKPYKKKENEIKKLEKEKQDNLNLEHAKKIGDKICDIYGIKGFPFSNVNKAYDAPYSVYDEFGSYCMDIDGIEQHLKKLTDEEDKELDKLWDDFCNNITSKQCLKIKDESDYLYPGDNVYMFYIKGGKFERVTDDEVDDIM